MLQQQQQLLNGATAAKLQAQDPNLLLALLSNQGLKSGGMLENGGIPHQFIPKQAFEMGTKPMKYGSSQSQQQIFNDDDQDQDDEGSDDEEAMQSDEEHTNPEEEYDDSEEAEDEDYPYDNSDDHELKNGQSIESSNSSPLKADQGEQSKIEKFAKENLAEKFDKLDIDKLEQ